MQVSKEAQPIGLCVLIKQFINCEIRNINYTFKADPLKVTIVKNCKCLLIKRSY